MLEAGRERERWLISSFEALVDYTNARDAGPDNIIPLPVLPFILEECGFEDDVFPGPEEGN